MGRGRGDRRSQVDGQGTVKILSFNDLPCRIGSPRIVQCHRRVRCSTLSEEKLVPASRKRGQMQDLRGSRKIRPGLIMVSHPSRSEASYQSRAGHGRGAEIRRNLVGGGWLVEFTLNGEPLRAVVVSTDDTAHDVAQEDVDTGRIA